MDGEFPIHVNRKGYGELVLEELFFNGKNGAVTYKGTEAGTSRIITRIVKDNYNNEHKELAKIDNECVNILTVKIEEDDDYMYLVMPYCEMRLLEFVTSAKYEDLWTSELRGDERPSKNLTEFLKELVTGIKSLHGVNIVHGDITPHNVLVHFRRDGDKKLKPSPRIICVGSINNPKGTVGFRAPEVIAVGELTICSDMFSVGCLLYFCLTKEDNLFGNFDKRDDNVIKRHYNLRRIDHMEEAKDLIGNLLDHDSTMRRTSSQVLQHPIFLGFQKTDQLFIRCERAFAWTCSSWFYCSHSPLGFKTKRILARVQ